MSILGSDSPSRTESKESAPRRPEEDAARSPYAPRRARLMHGGPPLHLGKPLVSDVPRFLTAPDSIDADPWQSQPVAGPRNCSPCGPGLLGSARPIRTRPATLSPASIPALRLDIEGREASRRLKRQSADLDRPRSAPLSPPYPHQTAENAGGCTAVRRLLEPENQVPPALMRAQLRNADGPALKRLRGPLLILIVGSVVAAAAYFVEGSSAPPLDTRGEPKLATVGLEATIAPPLPALQNDLQPTERRDDAPDPRPSPGGENSSSVVPGSTFTNRIEGRNSHAGERKRAAHVAVSPAAPQARSGGNPASRALKSKQAIQGSGQCAKRCAGSSCLPVGDCAQVPVARLPQANTNPPPGLNR
jgi:hypothetical protein